jgi:hypothetical protein
MFIAAYKIAGCIHESIKAKRGSLQSLPLRHMKAPGLEMVQCNQSTLNVHPL